MPQQRYKVSSPREGSSASAGELSAKPTEGAPLAKTSRLWEYVAKRLRKPSAAAKRPPKNRRFPPILWGHVARWATGGFHLTGLAAICYALP